MVDFPERPIRSIHPEPAAVGKEPGAALDRAGIPVRRALRTADPVGHAGDDERGLHQDRPGEGPAGADGRREARSAGRAHPDPHDLRVGPGPAARRRDHHRGHVLPARARPVHHPGDPDPGLPGGHGRGDAGGLLHRHRQHGRGHPVRGRRPPGEDVMPASGDAEQPGLPADGAPALDGGGLASRWRGGRGQSQHVQAGLDTVTDPGSRALLEVDDLRVQFPTDDGLVKSVDGISFKLERGKTLGIVGESGSGKSVTSLAIMGLHHGGNAKISGQIWLDGEELVQADPARVRALRGSKMAMIFQDPLSALHPYYTVGHQIAEAYLVHNKVSRKAAKARAVEMLDRVGIPNPQARVDDYPHQFSGGMRQRAMIAMALSCNPELLIADEPTTALDVTVQAQILDLISELQEEFGSAVIIITHDLGVVAEITDDILVMYAGRTGEYGTGEDIFDRPAHPYAWGLLSSMPRMDRDRIERLIPIPGTPPSLIRVPSGCPFHPRCAYTGLTGGRCDTEVPPLRAVALGHETACHLAADEQRRIWAELVEAQFAPAAGQGEDE